MVGEPLRREVRARGLQHPSPVRPPVRVHQHGERPVGLAAAGEEQRRAELAFAEREEARPRLDRARLRDVLDRPHRLARTPHRRDRLHAVRRRRDPDERPAALGARMQPGLLGQPHRSALGGPAPQVDLGRVAVGGSEQHALAGGQHDPNLQTRRRHGLAAHGQPVRVGLRIHHHVDHATVGQTHRRVLGQLDPTGVGLLGHDARRARRRVRLEEPDRALIPRLDEQRERRTLAPVDAGQVGEPFVVPRHLDALAALEVEHPQRDHGVVRAGLRVADRAGLGGRVRRVADEPGQHLALVDVRGGELRGVGRPPVAAVALHLLGRDELGEPPVRVGRVGRGELADASLDLAHVERPVDHERDPLARAVQARVVDRPGRAQLAGRTLHQIGQEHPARDGEHRSSNGLVGRVRRDARRTLARALAPGAFGLGEVAFGLLLPRVEHQPFLGPGDLEHPQAADRVVARLGAQVDDPLAVGRDREGAGHAEREPPRPRDLPRELLERIRRLGHRGPSLPTAVRG